MTLNKTNERTCSTQSPGEIKRREVSWTLTKKLETLFAGPGEIKRREVSWTLTKKLDFICGSRRDQEEVGDAGPSGEIRWLPRFCGR